MISTRFLNRVSHAITNIAVDPSARFLSTTLGKASRSPCWFHRKCTCSSSRSRIRRIVCREIRSSRRRTKRVDKSPEMDCLPKLTSHITVSMAVKDLLRGAEQRELDSPFRSPRESEPDGAGDLFSLHRANGDRCESSSSNVTTSRQGDVDYSLRM